MWGLLTWPGNADDNIISIDAWLARLSEQRLTATVYSYNTVTQIYSLYCLYNNNTKKNYLKLKFW